MDHQIFAVDYFGESKSCQSPWFGTLLLFTCCPTQYIPFCFSIFPTLAIPLLNTANLKFGASFWGSPNMSKQYLSDALFKQKLAGLASIGCVQSGWVVDWDLQEGPSLLSCFATESL